MTTTTTLDRELILRAKSAAFLASNPAFAKAIATFSDNPVHAKNAFAADVIFKFKCYGSVSDKAAAAVVASLARDVEFAAKRAAEAALAGPAPTGRVTITGTVLTVKEVFTSFGEATKMLVKLDNLSKVWLTAPSAATIAKGDTVTVTATFTVSKDDKSFAFGSRPKLVALVPAAPVTAVPTTPDTVTV